MDQSLLFFFFLVVFAVVISSSTSAGSTVPAQVHLSLLSAYTQEYAVQWVTWVPTPSSMVMWGTRPDDLYMNSTGFSYQYDQFANWTGFVHEAILSNLAPNTLYFYIVGDGATQWSSLFNFTTLPTPGRNVPLKANLFGDMGLDFESDGTVQYLSKSTLAGDVHLNFHLGDIAYTTHGPMNPWDTNQTRFDLFMDKISPFSGNAPYMVAAGNQESPFRFVEYMNRWRMPSNESGSDQSNLYYSFDAGPVHFAVVSTEHKLDNSSAQYLWLINDLQKADSNRASIPWIVLIGHRPMYCSNTPEDFGSFHDCYFIGVGIRNILEPLLDKYGVDLYLAGHMHDGEYTYPVLNGKAVATNFNNPQATVHVTSGYGGCREGFDLFNATFDPAWSAWREDSHDGYAVMTAFNATHMHLEFVFADDGLVHDDFWIIKSESRFSMRGVQSVSPAQIPKFFNLNASVVSGLSRDPNIAKLLSGSGHVPSILLPADVSAIVEGFFEGLELSIGSVPDLIADLYPITYDLGLGLNWTFEGLKQHNETLLSLGVQRLKMFVVDIVTIVHDSGAFVAVSEIEAIAAEIKTEGYEKFIEHEALKIAEHAEEVSELMQNAQQFWEGQYYGQAGFYVGQLAALLLAP